MTKEEAIEFIFHQYAAAKQFIESNINNPSRDDGMLDYERKEMEATMIALISLDQSFSDKSKVETMLKEFEKECEVGDVNEYERELVEKLTPTGTTEQYLGEEINEKLTEIFRVDEDEDDKEELDYGDTIIFSPYVYKGRVYVIVNDVIDRAFQCFSEEFQKAMNSLYMVKQ